MKHTHICNGTCSRTIDIEIDNYTGLITSVKYTGGCHGNTQGVSALAVGMKPQDVIDRCLGIRCKDKPTSCPAQLALGLQEMLNAKQAN